MDDIANIWIKLNVNARNSYIILNKAERQKEKRRAGARAEETKTNTIQM